MSMNMLHSSSWGNKTQIDAWRNFGDSPDVHWSRPFSGPGYIFSLLLILGYTLLLPLATHKCTDAPLMHH